LRRAPWRIAEVLQLCRINIVTQRAHDPATSQAKDELRALAAIGMFAPLAVAALIAIAIFALIFFK
jgi:hypothetical protein